MKKNSFEQFCVDNNYQELLNLWDYELNHKTPDNISKSTSEKVWLKCPRGLHESSYVYLGNITKAYAKNQNCCICHRCNSIGQYIIDNYGQDYLDKIWSDKNTVSYLDIEKSSKLHLWLRCLNDDTHPDYDLSANNFHKSHSCPYCSGKRVCKTNSFGALYPDLTKYWSNKNDVTPYECLPNTNQKYYFKCENAIHRDYLRSLSDQITTKHLCPECYQMNRKDYCPRGENSPFWKGNLVKENRRARDCWQYDDWRKSVYKKDDYTCQCCGQRGGILNAHHIKSFAKNKDIRYDVANGITLCKLCHDSSIKGSFHNMYGTNDNTPEELELYINDKRKEYGIDIPFSLESYLAGSILKHSDIDQNSKQVIDIDENNNENNYGEIAV